MAAHQGPPSLEFSRQEHWSGLPFPSPIHESEKWKWSSLSHVQLLVTPWTAAYQAPPPMGFSRQEYWSGFPLPSPIVYIYIYIIYMLAPWKKSYYKPKQHIKKQRHYFADKGLFSQGYGFSISHVWMLELDYKENWAPKNWCFCTVVWEKTLESPKNCKEIQPAHSKGYQSWSFIGRTDVEAEAPILRPPDMKNWLLGKDPDAGKDSRPEEKGMTEDEMVGWHHWHDGHEFK